MKTTMRVAVILAAGLLLGADKKDAKKDTDLVQGTWQLTELVRNGEKANQAEVEKATLTIKGDKFTFKVGDETHEGSFTFDSATTPKNMDIVPSGGGDFKGIYSVTATEFKLCLSLGGDRPKAFEAKADSGCILIVTKKAKD
jgi:uncharacterized protein (TIGR03067 family)